MEKWHLQLCKRDFACYATKVNANGMAIFLDDLSLNTDDFIKSINILFPYINSSLKLNFYPFRAVLFYVHCQ